MSCITGTAAVVTIPAAAPLQQQQSQRQPAQYQQQQQPGNRLAYQQRQRMMDRRFDTLPISYAQLLSSLQQLQLVQLRTLAPPIGRLPVGYDANARCSFHSGAPGHDIENCKAFKHVADVFPGCGKDCLDCATQSGGCWKLQQGIQALLDKGILQVEGLSVQESAEGVEEEGFEDATDEFADVVPTGSVIHDVIELDSDVSDVCTSTPQTRRNDSLCTTPDPIDNGSAMSRFDFENPIFQAEEEGDEDCELPEELTRLLKQEERVIQPHQESVEVINLGTEDAKREIKIGAALEDNMKKGLIELLQEYVDIFAWSYQDMPGLDTNIVVHRLPLKEVCPPVKQKLRRTRPEMAVKIKEEVQSSWMQGF
ncbi:hypothetical protein KIW84_075941 [Lathyrus oleraceus]|uniref:Gag-pol polyprotein n=1 Tax=Pisum sativum TaxID=3888 RepID=A0A9D4VWN1_PEA|nr:hypothetical protein KIW84_075941 [Pisum sativum]